MEALKNAEANPRPLPGNPNAEDLFKYSIIQPSLILGKAFEPGNDDQRYCKPTAVQTMANGDFFVSDGYCNSRIVKYNREGEKITQWGRSWTPQGKHTFVR